MEEDDDQICCVGHYVEGLSEPEQKIINKLVKKISKIVEDYEFGEVALDLFLHRREVEEQMIEEYRQAKIQEN